MRSDSHVRAVALQPEDALPLGHAAEACRGCLPQCAREAHCRDTGGGRHPRKPLGSDSGGHRVVFEQFTGANGIKCTVCTLSRLVGNIGLQKKIDQLALTELIAQFYQVDKGASAAMFWRILQQLCRRLISDTNIRILSPCKPFNTLSVSKTVERGNNTHTINVDNCNQLIPRMFLTYELLTYELHIECTLNGRIGGLSRFSRRFQSCPQVLRRR